MKAKPYLTQQGNPVPTRLSLGKMSQEDIAAKWDDPAFQAEVRAVLRGGSK